MERDRSPSPEFMKPQEKITQEDETDHVQESQPNKTDNQTPDGKMYQQGYVPTLDEIKEGKS